MCSSDLYRARDLRLKRDVAIKVLPHAWSNDPDRVTRFHREAELLATLNHPNVGAIYGYEEDGGVEALVLELVEGPTLADRLHQGPLSLANALPIARQIADALAAAHDRGIVHRDLKPSNIKVREYGTVKILDFGLAKVVEPTVPSDDSDLATVAGADRTHAGTILGTPAYMSPEQARGLPVDKRTDVWAFGCVLYEMVTGRPAFSGATVADILAAILGREPDWTALPAETPESLRRLLRRCLEKDVTKRLRDVGDAIGEIEDERAQPSRGSVAGGQRQWFALAFAGAIVLAVAVGGITFWLSTRGAGGPASDSQTVLQQLTDYGGSETSGTISPDGRSFAFISGHAGTPDIWLRQVSGGEPVRLTNDAAIEADLAFSPDGDTIYFTRTEGTRNSLWRIGVLGGQPRKVLDDAQKPAVSKDGRLAVAKTSPRTAGTWEIAVSDLNGGASRGLVDGISSSYPPSSSWSQDGRLLAYSSQVLSGPFLVFVVDVASGQARQAATLTSPTMLSGHVPWLPDSRHVVVAYSATTNQELGLLDTTDGSVSRLTTSVAGDFLNPSVAGDGTRIVATISRNLNEAWKLPLGADPDANSRAAVRILDASKDAFFTHASRDGRQLLYNGLVNGARNLWLWSMDDRAPRQITNIKSGGLGHYALSPDGGHVTFVAGSAGHADIFVQNIDGSALRQLTNDDAANSWPIWSPDGEWIAYLRNYNGRREEWRVKAAGGTPEKFLDQGFRGDWIKKPDGSGTWIAAAGIRSNEAVARPTPLRLIDAERGTVVWTYPDTDSLYTTMPMFSPDGRFLSATFGQPPNPSIVRIFDTATGASRVVATLPFQAFFRANWVDDGRALVVSRSETVEHVVMLDRLLSAR